jgi:hypothetical protein
MKPTLILIGLLYLLSCTDVEEKSTVVDLVEQNEEGNQEIKVEQLTVEDIERLEAEAGTQGQTYNGVLNNDVEKAYPLKADTNQQITWILEGTYPNAQLFIYKETISSVKKDSVSYMKIKDFKLVCQSDSCSQKNKKQTNYKAVVKLNPKFSTLDSTCEYTLRILK